MDNRKMPRGLKTREELSSRFWRLSEEQIDQLMPEAFQEGTIVVNRLDPGIEYAVQVLRANGIETYESCQGGAGHSYAEPTVCFSGEYGAGFKALDVALSYALPVKQLNRFWTVNPHGEPVGPQWEMVFWDAYDGGE